MAPMTDPQVEGQDGPVTALTPGMGGRWLITTRGSTHIWDLDATTYTRIPGSSSGSGPFAFDGRPLPISRVDRWPRIGSTSLIWIDDPYAPDTTLGRRSSVIVSITALPST
jgi:hypothetical protein